MDFVTSHRVEADGSHTVTMTVLGLPSLERAQQIADWMHDLVRRNAHEVGGTPTGRPDTLQ